MEASNAPGGDRWREEALKQVLSGMEGEILSNDAAAGAQPGATCPTTYEAPLPRYDEDTRVVMGLLWIAFATGAADTTSDDLGTLDVRWRAVVLGDQKTSGYVYDQVVAHGGTAGGWVAPLVARWEQLGGRAMNAASADGTAVIQRGHFELAWNAAPPNPELPPRELNPVDEATEIVGGPMWFKLHLGTLVTRDLPYDNPEGIVRRGRTLSRYWVRLNVVKFGVVDGDQIDYDRWPFDGVATCATQTGRRAHRDAAQAGSSEITADHLESAWCTVHGAMVRHTQRSGLSMGTFSAACG